jgi:hypothetical protein
MGKAKLRVVIASPAGDHSYLVAARNQTASDASQLLGSSHNVRPETLIEEQDFHVVFVA